MFTGARLAQWSEIEALALRAHSCFPGRVLLAFDIAPTPNGPVLVEVNTRGDTRLLQFMDAAPLGETCLAALVRPHLAKTE